MSRRRTSRPTIWRPSDRRPLWPLVTLAILMGAMAGYALLLATTPAVEVPVNVTTPTYVKSQSGPKPGESIVEIPETGPAATAAQGIIECVQKQLTSSGALEIARTAGTNDPRFLSALKAAQRTCAGGGGTPSIHLNPETDRSEPTGATGQPR